MNGYYEMARRFVAGKDGKFGKVKVERMPRFHESIIHDIEEKRREWVRYHVNSRIVASYIPFVEGPTHPAMSVYNEVSFFWPCYTEEIEQHINRILRALHSPLRVNHVDARMKRVYTFSINGSEKDE